MESITESITKLEAKCEKLNFDIQSLISLVQKIQSGNKKHITGYDIFKEKFIKILEGDKSQLTESINIWLTMQRMNKLMNKQIDDEWNILPQRSKDSYDVAAVRNNLYNKS